MDLIAIVSLVAAATCLMVGVFSVLALQARRFQVLKAANAGAPSDAATATAGRPLYEISVIGGSWVAVPLAWAMLEGRDARISALAAVTAALTTAAAVEAVRVRRDGTPKIKKIHLTGLALGVVAWLFNGIVNLFTFINMQTGYVCSGSGESFKCVHRPGLAVDALGAAPSLLATPLLAVSLWAGLRSRVAAWLAPLSITSLYLLALDLWTV